MQNTNGPLNGTILGLHLMLTGDLVSFEGKNEGKSTKVEFHFEGGESLALADRFKNAFVKLHPEDKKGIDALDPKLNYAYLKKALNRKAVRDFMDIHTRKKDKSPTGAKIKIAARGMLKTYNTDEQVLYT